MQLKTSGTLRTWPDCEARGWSPLQETEEGRRWAESKIKTLTGGDPISTRLMRQDFFTYLPAYKLVITGNHKPALRGVDEAMRRRFHLVPFTVTITKPDRDLPEMLRAEWPGILRWPIDGCLAWQGDRLSSRDRAPGDGLLPRRGIRYRPLDRRFRILDPTAFCESKQLWPSWQRWATEANEFVGSQKGMALQGHSFKSDRDSTGKARGYRGLQLAPPPPSDSDDGNPYSAHLGALLFGRGPLVISAETALRIHLAPGIRDLDELVALMRGFASRRGDAACEVYMVGWSARARRMRFWAWCSHADWQPLTDCGQATVIALPKPEPMRARRGALDGYLVGVMKAQRRMFEADPEGGALLGGQVQKWSVSA